MTDLSQWLLSWGSSTKTSSDTAGKGSGAEAGLGVAHGGSVAAVVGVVQPNEKPSRVMSHNKPQQLEFHSIDVPALVSRWA